MISEGNSLSICHPLSLAKTTHVNTRHTKDYEDGCAVEMNDVQHFQFQQKYGGKVEEMNHNSDKE